MKHLIRLFVRVLVPAFVLAGVVALPAMAQDKMKDTKMAPAAMAEKGKATITVLKENDKVRAYEVRFKPGDEITPSVSSTRVVRALKGGTIQRNYADGKTEKVEYKNGQVRINTPSGPYTAKNIGKTEVVLYVVLLK
jgi:hypothetical protein